MIERSFVKRQTYNNFKKKIKLDRINNKELLKVVSRPERNNSFDD